MGPRTTASRPSGRTASPTGISVSQWEKLCRRCGQCCFEKWVDGDGTIYPTRVACQHLDVVTRLCRVYPKRFEVGEGCIRLTPEVVATVQWLPEDCGYRLWLKEEQTHPPI